MNDKIIAHAKKMRVAADSTHAKCVDGGYRGEEAVGAIAMPGAHLGISMALLRLGFSPEEAFELVYKFVTKDCRFVLSCPRFICNHCSVCR